MRYGYTIQIQRQNEALLFLSTWTEPEITGWNRASVKSNDCVIPLGWNVKPEYNVGHQTRLSGKVVSGH